MEGQLLITQPPVLLGHRTPPHRFRRQALASRFHDANVAEMAFNSRPIW